MSRDDGRQLILASGSPRRLELLRGVGIEPVVRPADIDETPMAGEKPTELVERLAADKAAAVWQRLQADDEGSDGACQALVVAADTVLDVDGEVFGKPADDAEAAEMLGRLAGRSHAVVTGLAVIGHVDQPGAGRSERRIVRSDRADVWFRALDDRDIAWYLASGEHRGKAGAYAIQGLGSLFVARIEGSYQSIVGLSLPALDDVLIEFGVRLRELSS